MDAITGPPTWNLLPREIPTELNKSPIVRAVTALLMVISIMGTITRAVMKLGTIRAIAADDYLLFSATGVSIIESILVIVQSRGHGIGIHQYALRAFELSRSQKLEYASNVLYVLCIALAKFSATRTLLYLTMLTHQVIVIYIIEAVVGMWAVASIFTLLFQCRLPRPWNYTTGHCIQKGAFWTSFDIINIVTDMAIIIVMLNRFKCLHTEKSKKILVIFAFGSRIVNIAPIILHIYYYDKAVDSTDHTFDMLLPTILVQVIQCVAILTTCMPNLLPFLDSVQSGQMRAGELPQNREKHASHTGDRESTALDSSGSKSRQTRQFHSLVSEDPDPDTSEASTSVRQQDAPP